MALSCNKEDEGQGLTLFSSKQGLELGCPTSKESSLADGLLAIWGYFLAHFFFHEKFQKVSVLVSLDGNKFWNLNMFHRTKLLLSS